MLWKSSDFYPFSARQSVLKPREAQGNNRSVMPLDVLGHTRVTLSCSTRDMWIYRFTYKFTLGGDAWVLMKATRAGDRSLELSVVNEEFLVNVLNQSAVITSL